ncbi:hypothetical protein QFZ26_001890 [Agromyces ramosus]|uniref:Uncharacterized protein n=1 Tax=Agromyces ramosus TaxID=33879 RepID=A0ABU0R8C4_9MICO|nr:hypothetical protein [Agromyces ramosus]
MPTPGAVISGFSTWVPATGPRLEKSAVVSSRSTAPTVSAAGAHPGVDTVLSAGPSLPAAITKRLSLVSESDWVAMAIGSTHPSTGPVLPRLMDTTSAPCATAHSMPAMIPEVDPEPPSVSTLPTSRSARGATPWFAPSLARPDPPTVDATCVPWPLPSFHDPNPVKSSPAMMRP